MLHLHNSWPNYFFALQHQRPGAVQEIKPPSSPASPDCLPSTKRNAARINAWVDPQRPLLSIGAITRPNAHRA